jgi:anti-sigma regulatory factor (Ser/Thr protein kinase)
VNQYRALFDVPATAAGPAMARQVVAAVVDGWQLAPLRVDAVLVVSELVTNAFMHAAGADSYELTLERGDDGLRIALADGSAIVPVIRELEDGEAGGFGMRLVRTLATRWGHEQHDGGKHVWVELTAAPPEPPV